MILHVKFFINLPIGQRYCGLSDGYYHEPGEWKERTPYKGNAPPSIFFILLSYRDFAAGTIFFFQDCGNMFLMVGIMASGRWLVSSYRKSHIEFADLIWAQSDQQFVCKCKEITQPIRGQEMVGIQQSVTVSKH